MAQFFEQALERARWRPQRQVIVLVMLAVVITLIFGGIYLTQIANYASINREIEGLIDQRDRLERENEALRADIARLQTVPSLLARAEALGFVNATSADIQYLVIPGYNPYREEEPEDPLALLVGEDEIIAVQYDETFQGWLQSQWAGLRRQFDEFGR